MKTEYLTLADLGAIFKKRIVRILLAALVLAVAGFLLRALLPPKYSATATFYVRNLQSEPFLEANGLTSSQLAVVQTLAKEYAAVVTEGDALLDRMIEKHALSLSREALREMLTAAPDSTAFTVTATAGDTATADAVIAAVEAELPAYIQETAWPNLSVDFTVVTLLLEAAPAARATAPPVLWGVFGALGGLVLSYLFFLCRFLFSNRLNDPAEIDRVLPPNTPLLGVIPEISTPAAATEPFYALAARLPRTEGAGAVTLAVTSAVAGEGTSYVAAGLANSLAVAGKKVLLIDADLRGCDKEAFFLPKEALGLSSYLKDPQTVPEKLVQKTEQAGLSLLPAGREQILPCACPFSARIAALLATFSPRYDYIVAELPAVAQAADAIVCTADFSATLLVTAPKRCGARQLRAAVAALTAAGGTVLGAVANHPPKNIMANPFK